MFFTAKIRNWYQRYAARRMFSRWSPIYEEEVAENHYSAADKVAACAIAALGQGGIETPMIVDVGIGTGLVAEQLKEALPCMIVGMDFTEDMLAICTMKQVADMIIKCDVGKDLWPLEDGSADAVLSAGLFEYLTTDMVQHFLQQASRILRPESLLILTYIPSDSGQDTADLWNGHTGRFLTCAAEPDALCRRIEAEGLRIIEHSEPFKGSVFSDGSFYFYRMITAQKLSA